jgi:NAD-dependent deacetylase
MDEKEAIKRIKGIMSGHPRVVFLGGAGVSTASGIPDFRSPEGLYKIHSEYGVPYETMLSHTYFKEHTDAFYDFYWKTMVRKDAKPNAAHIALANYERQHHPIAILTQNIDGLHADAGSRAVYELHGSVRRYYCENCGQFYDLKDIVPHGIPHCRCGGLLKPDVVLYEEPLDESLLEKAVDALRYSDVLIVGGTSLNVYPAAGLINYFGGSTSIIVNKEPTPRDSFFDYVIHDDVGKILTEILQ